MKNPRFIPFFRSVDDISSLQVFCQPFIKSWKKSEKRKLATQWLLMVDSKALPAKNAPPTHTGLLSKYYFIEWPSISKIIQLAPLTTISAYSQIYSNNDTIVCKKSRSIILQNQNKFSKTFFEIFLLKYICCTPNLHGLCIGVWLF